MDYLHNVRRLKSLIGEATGLEPPGRWQAFGTDISDRVLRQDRLPVRMASERRSQGARVGASNRNVLRSSQEESRAAARPLPSHRGTAPDRMDNLNEPKGRNQPCTIFVLQQRLQRTSCGDVCKPRSERHAGIRRKNKRVRLQSRRLGFASSDER